MATTHGLRDCRVCGSAVTPLFESPAKASMSSSTSELIPAATVVDLCEACGHAQTRPITDLEQYYASEYNFLADNREQDDLYESKGSTITYRSDHQAAIAEAKLDLSQPMRVLDFGCAKAKSLRLLAERHPQIAPYVFDISDAYRSYWDEFTTPDQQASFEVPTDWAGQFDLVLSYFALEHVEEPVGFLKMLRSLLSDSGQILLIVPNMAANMSDLLVVDHVNHFSAASLLTAFNSAGFGNVSVDDTAFRGAFVVVAGRNGEAAEVPASLTAEGVERARIAQRFWTGSVEKLREFEAAQPPGSRSAIYGSGMYGLFIASCLRSPELLEGFLDQNPHRKGMTFLGAPVISPAEVSDDVAAVYVGLNPAIARDVIANVAPLARRPRSYLYL